jgi:hypothetical protein
MPEVVSRQSSAFSIKTQRKGAEAQGRKNDRNVFLRLCVFAPLR